MSPCIDFRFLEPLLSALRQFGFTLPRILQEAELPVTAVCPAVQAIPAPTFIRVFGIAIRRLEHCTRHRSSSHMHSQDTSDLLAYCLAGSSTLAEATQRARIFNDSIITGSKIGVSECGQHVKVTFDSHRRDRNPGSHLVDIVLLVVYRKLFGWLVGNDIAPQLAGLAYSPATTHFLLTDALDAPVRHDQAENYLMFLRHDFLRPVVRTHADIAGLVGQFPFNLCFRSTTEDIPLADRVRSLLSEALERSSPVPTSTSVAESLCMSSATLRRRLRAERTSFGQL